MLDAVATNVTPLGVALVHALQVAFKKPPCCVANPLQATDKTGQSGLTKALAKAKVEMGA